MVGVKASVGVAVAVFVGDRLGASVRVGEAVAVGISVRDAVIAGARAGGSVEVEMLALDDSVLVSRVAVEGWVAAGAGAATGNVQANPTRTNQSGRQNFTFTKFSMQCEQHHPRP